MVSVTCAAATVHPSSSALASQHVHLEWTPVELYLSLLLLALKHQPQWKVHDSRSSCRPATSTRYMAPHLQQSLLSSLASTIFTLSGSLFCLSSTFMSTPPSLAGSGLGKPFSTSCSSVRTCLASTL